MDDSNKERNDSPILEGTFSIHPSSKPVYKVTLNATEITYCSIADTNSKQYNSIQLADVIGCHCMKGKDQADKKAYFSVYSYPYMKKRFSSKVLRRRVAVTFTVAEFEAFKDNLTVTQKWKRALVSLLKSKSPFSLGSKKRMLVLVNPFSGPGKALKLFQDHVSPILEEADIRFHMVVTEYAGHARDMMATLNLSEWYCIVIVSGDGLIYEVFNGLMNRDNWREAIKMPIGTLPGGSGNALSCAINYASGEPYLDNGIMHSALILTKPDVVPMDIVALETAAGIKHYSFLSVAWGMFSDIDVDSERFRNLGDVRFFLEGVVKISAKKLYEGDLFYLPLDDDEDKDDKPKQLTRTTSVEDIKESASESLRQRNWSCPAKFPGLETGANKQQDGEEDQNNGPDSTDLENVVISINGNNNMDPTSTDDAHNSEENTALPTEDSNPTDQDIGVTQGNGNAMQNMVDTSLLVPLDQPVPSTWITRHIATYSFGAVYQTHLNKDSFGSPNSKFDDGIIYLSSVKSTTTRIGLLQFLAETTDGSHVDNPSHEVIKCKAFRLVPKTTEGYLCVDGERIEYGPIQGQVLPSLARIITRNK